MATEPADLAQWGDREKRAYLEYRALGHSQVKSAAMVVDRFDCHHYNQSRLAKFELLVKSRAGLKEFEDEIDVKSLPFARRRQRVAALGQLAILLQNRVEEERKTATGNALAKLAGEFSATLGKIREEVEQLPAREKDWGEQMVRNLEEISANTAGRKPN